jgi:hypothetical protein
MPSAAEYFGVFVGTAEGVNSVYQGASEAGGTTSTVATLAGAYGAVTAPMMLTPVGAMVLGPGGVAIGLTKITLDAAYTNSFAPGDILTTTASGIGAIAGMALVGGAALPFGAATLLVAGALGAAGGLLNLAGVRIPIVGMTTDLLSTWSAEGWPIDPTTNTSFTSAQNWRQPRDPLVLDLDGDGIEATAINPAAPVLFDHDADGIKTGTGWIAPDDGLLVLDVNGNGTIDSGRELFGDNTLLPNTSTAANGFAALAQHDANADGRINSADAIYAQLKIWQDANQDGISQSTELKTLSQLGIASINVTGTAGNTNLGNGNTMPFTGSFTRTNAITRQMGIGRPPSTCFLAEASLWQQVARRDCRNLGANYGRE